jgi:hypothetical protein
MKAATSIEAGSMQMRQLLRVGLAALALQSAVSSEALAAPMRWSGNGHLYEVRFAPEGLSWAQAMLRAQALGCGRYLATLTSPAENAFVARLAAARPGAFTPGGPWLGAFQKTPAESASNWRWVTNEPFAPTNWGPGEPSNNDGAEDFLGMFAGGAWNDATLFGTGNLPRAFIVEFDTARQRACRRLG